MFFWLMKTTQPWKYDEQGQEAPNFYLESALGFNIARRAWSEKSLSKTDLESLYGKISGVAAALNGALPFAFAEPHC
jgi:hypothetical protein